MNQNPKPLPLFANTCPTAPQPATVAPPVAARPAPEACAPVHPAGRLYTLLRHGRGLSPEEAHRVSCDAI
ncbi:MAG: hypothetical protein Q7U56_02030, partial [Humidesulfovibrio sp.]|nr:hypothetical protein [Humidesulfovibrio sp.]